MAVALVFSACGAPTYTADAGGASDRDASDEFARQRDARVPADAATRTDAAPPSDATRTDAAPPSDALRADAALPSDAARVDAALPADAGGGGGTDASSSLPGGTVSCYADVRPTATCTLPVHCCFTNYSSQHNGTCTTDACVWGTISCDGPEDCGEGQRCCAHAIMDAEDINVGYTLACQSTACGPAPINQEMCHPGANTCPAGKTCVTAYGNDNDLPRTLYICK